jgi:hypothetical protein
MDSAYLSAIAALAGSTIGGLTSLTATWVTQRAQFSAQQRARERSSRQQLYQDFIDEASRLYGDAYAHDQTEVSNLVNLYALISKMRVQSSAAVIESADTVARTIIETYLSRNKTFRDLTEILDDEAMNPLRHFSNACRKELQESQ